MRNPLSVVPKAAYEEDLVASVRGRTRIIWVTAPALPLKFASPAYVAVIVLAPTVVSSMLH